MRDDFGVGTRSRFHLRATVARINADIDFAKPSPIQADLAIFSQPWMVIFGAAFLLVSLAGTSRTIRSRAWEERTRLMFQASVSEISLFYAVVVFLLIGLGPVSSFCVAAFPLVWYVAVKRALWGSVSRVMA